MLRVDADYVMKMIKKFVVVVNEQQASPVGSGKEVGNVCLGDDC